MSNRPFIQRRILLKNNADSLNEGYMDSKSHPSGSRFFPGLRGIGSILLRLRVQGKPGEEPGFFCCLGARPVGVGDLSFVTCCYSGGYKMASSQLDLFQGGRELFVLQVIENQSSINRTAPNLCKPISGQVRVALFPRIG